MTTNLPWGRNALLLASILVSTCSLTLQAGNRASAQVAAESARQAQPGSLEARIAVVRSLIASGHSSQAQTEIVLLLKEAPDVAIVHALSGMHQARVNNPHAARLAYERALELSPGLLAALGGLTYLDLSVRDTASAITRLEREIARQPDNPNLLVLLSRVYSAAGDAIKQEEALRRAVTVDPRFTSGYTMLAELYLKQKRVDDARAEFAAISERDPSNTMAGTLVGILLEQLGKRDDAMKAYERVVNGPGNSHVAANNLAFMHAENGTNLDLALQLAISAKQGLPDDPSVDDTIGWIYYKKDQPALAVKPLESALKRLPSNAELLVHLGLTYAKLGDSVKARETLERALKLNPKVAGADEARRVLASLSQQ
jgi:tetratricopeptide (TPR) repeat protein